MEKATNHRQKHVYQYIHKPSLDLGSSTSENRINKKTCVCVYWEHVSFCYCAESRLCCWSASHKRLCKISIRCCHGDVISPSLPQTDRFHISGSPGRRGSRRRGFTNELSSPCRRVCWPSMSSLGASGRSYPPSSSSTATARTHSRER